MTQALKSKLLSIIRRGPQGSASGPILFILFTNDLPQYMQEYNKTLLYAYDTVLLLVGKIPEVLEKFLWFILSRHTIYCNHNNSLPACSKKNFSHWSSKEAKYLGATINQKLNWTPPIDILCSKLNSSWYVIKRIKIIS